MKKARKSIVWSLALVCGIQGCATLLQAQESSIDEADKFLATIEQKAEKIAREYSSSIVSIACISKRRQRSLFSPEIANKTWAHSLVLEPSDPGYIATRYATGVVWDERGSIVTPFSTLGDPNDTEYLVWNSLRVAKGELVGIQAEVIAGEPYTNLAVLRIGDQSLSQDFVPLSKIDFATAKAGGLCIELSCPGPVHSDGNPNAQWGSVTAVGRSVQTDTSSQIQDGIDRRMIYSHGALVKISQANSESKAGAAVFDLNGKLLGLTIDSLEISDGLADGSYVLPANRTLRRVLDALVQGKLPKFSFLGIQPGEVRSIYRRKGLYGTVVESIVPGMPAYNSGLRVEDVITKIGDEPVESRDTIYRALAAYEPGEQVKVTALRQRGNDRLLVETNITLSKRFVASDRDAYPADTQERWRGALIDYVTAFPPDLLFQQFRSVTEFDSQTIAVMDVRLDSPAWNAGLRPGVKILSVNGQTIASPDEFHRIVDTARGDVVVTLADEFMDRREITVHRAND